MVRERRLWIDNDTLRPDNVVDGVSTGKDGSEWAVRRDASSFPPEPDSNRISQQRTASSVVDGHARLPSRYINQSRAEKRAELMKHRAGILLFLVVDTSLHGPMIDARIMIISTRKICISPGLKKERKKRNSLTHSLLLLFFFSPNEYCSSFSKVGISLRFVFFFFISIVKYFEILSKNARKFPHRE